MTSRFHRLFLLLEKEFWSSRDTSFTSTTWSGVIHDHNFWNSDLNPRTVHPRISPVFSWFVKCFFTHPPPFFGYSSSRTNQNEESQLVRSCDRRSFNYTGRDRKHSFCESQDWYISSHRQRSGVDELRSDLGHWQQDKGKQPRCVLGTPVAWIHASNVTLRRVVILALFACCGLTGPTYADRTVKLCVDNVLWLVEVAPKLYQQYVISSHSLYNYCALAVLFWFSTVRVDTVLESSND